MIRSIACALAIAAAVPAASASAADANGRNEIVRFDDLNLAIPAGAMTLERRIDAAARRVCGYSEARAASHIMPRDYHVCLDNARASARQQVAAKTAVATRKG